ncbi:MAG: alcohol dehydrogenase catalytic domain-containing protein [Candidatus Bathyarchaeia archaeon]
MVEPRKFSIQEVELPPIKPTQMLVRIRSCGLCHSELGRYLGKGTLWTGESVSYPSRLGHEPAGIVEEVGEEVEGFECGDRVTGMGFGPSFSEYALVDFGDLRRVPMIVKAPNNVPIELCIGEPIKCCTTIVRYSQVKFGDYVFVAGCGFMGLLVIANLAWRGLSEIIACDLIDQRLQLAKELGATITLNPTRDDVVKEVKDATNGRMCDVAFEGIGRPAGVYLTSRVIKNSPPPGIIVLYGYHAWPDTYDLSLWGPKAPMVISLHPAYSPDQMHDLIIAMKAVEKGYYPLEKLITHRYKLENIDQGFKALEEPPEGFIKGIVTP